MAIIREDGSQGRYVQRAVPRTAAEAPTPVEEGEAGGGSGSEPAVKSASEAAQTTSEAAQAKAAAAAAAAKKKQTTGGRAAAPWDDEAIAAARRRIAYENSMTGNRRGGTIHVRRGWRAARKGLSADHTYNTLGPKGNVMPELGPTEKRKEEREE